MDIKWGSFKEETLSDDKDKLYKLFSQLLEVKNKDEIDSAYFIKFCQIHPSDNNSIENFDQAFEKINFETIFANRGISPNQSSRQIPINKDQNIYKSASDLAYVIRTHLNDRKECTDDGSESQYFRWLTEPQSYKFEFKDKTDKTEILVTCNNDDKPFPILKAPEGILEAKIMSITLSDKGTTTLLIDEPGRGMHPSMVDCLRDLVLYDVNKTQKKTVIFTTHNQRFICPSTFEKIFYFKSSKSGSEVISLGNELSNKKLKSKEYLCCDQVSPLFFSKRVIIVEGPDDIRFLGTLKNILLTDESRRRLVCGGNSESEHTLRKFLTSLHIISVGGTGNVKEIEPLCSALKLTDRQLRYYLFDSDALLTIKALINLDKKDIEDPSLEKIENNDIFVWFAYVKAIVDKFDELCSNDDSKKDGRTDELKKKRKLDEESRIEKLKKELKKYGRIEEALNSFYKVHDDKHHGPNKECIINKCTGMETFLKSKHLDITKSKIWNSNDISDIDIREIVKRIVDVSMTYGDDCQYMETVFKCPFKRLLQFLVKHAEKSYQ
ncbi:uncharacterized protein LOC127706682 [Mytilus californianus]|uniref:uncharacterized protein LOC127706682 n=1 Tax=Mytilus californianus TaxID=6549 RepID=UPI002245B0BD|nr:uncharacterized protein LOC127706682 [Mytilus californianus]